MAQNNTAKVNIALDVSGGKNSLNLLQSISTATGKIGDQASKVIKPLQKLLSAAESNKTLTSTDVQVMVNNLTTAMARLSSAVKTEQDAFNKQAKAYNNAKNKAAEYQKQLEELQKTEQSTPKVDKVMKFSQWADDKTERAKRAKTKFTGDLAGRGAYNDTYKSFYRTADSGQINAWSKKVIAATYQEELSKLSDKKKETYTEKKYQQDKARANAARDLKNNAYEQGYLPNAQQAKENWDALQKSIKNVTAALNEILEKKDNIKEKVVAEGGSVDESDNLQPSAALSSNISNYKAVQTQIDGLTNSVTTAQEELEKTGGSMLSLSSQAPRVTSSFGKMTSSIIKANVVMRTLRNLLKTSVQAVRSLDDSITNMAVVTGKSRQELQGMTGDFAQMAKNTSSTITEMANLTTEFLRQGRTMADAKTLAEETAKAAKIAGISTSDSITYMTAAINGFNLSASAASHVSDIFANLAAVSAVDYSGLAVALSKVAAQANQAGMSIEYTTALLAKGIETTQEAPESIGTALKTIIARFRELDDYGTSLEDGVSVNSVEKALKSVGIELRNEAGEFRDLSDVLNELGPKWDDLSTMQKQAIAQAAAGTRQQSRFLAIMQDWDRTLELVEDAENAAGAAAAQYAEYAGGLTAAITNLQSAWEYFTSTLTNTDWVVALANELSTIVTDIATVFNSMGDAVPIILTTVLGIAGASKLNAQLEIKKEQSILRQYNAYMGFADEQSKTLYEQIEAQKIQYEQEVAKLKQQNEALLAIKEGNVAENELTAELTRQLILRIKNTAQAKKLKAAENGTVANTSEEQAALAEANLSLAENEQKAAELKAALAEESQKQIDSNLKAIDEYQQKISTLEGFMSKLKTTSLSGLSSFTGGLSSIWKIGSKIKTLGIKGILSGIKTTIKSMLPSMLAIGAAVAAIYFTFKAIQKLTSMYDTDTYKSNISSLTTDSYKKRQSNTTLASLRNEYTELDKKANKTTEDLERLEEIKEQLADDFDISGDNITGQIDQQMAENSAAVAENISDAVTEGFKASIVSGQNMFADADFKATVSAQFDTYNTADTSTAQGQYQSNQYDKISDNLDYTSIAKNAGAGTGTDSTAATAAGLGTVGAVAGAIIGSIIPGIGTAIGGVLGGLVGGAAGVWGGAALSEAQIAAQAEKQAAQLRATLKQYAAETNQFAETMAEAYDQPLSNMVAKYKEAKESVTLIKDTVEQTYSAYEALSNVDSTILDKMQGVVKENGAVISVEISNTAIADLLDTLSEAGSEAGEAFVKKWTEAIQKGATSVEAIVSMFFEVSDDNSEVSTSIDDYTSEKYADAQAKADLYGDLRYSTKDTILKKLKEAGLEEEYNKVLEYGEEGAQLYMQSLYDSASETAKAFSSGEIKKKIQSQLLDMITTVGDISSLKDTLTAFNSAQSTIQDFADAVRNGTATMEQWAEAATTYADLMNTTEWKDAVAAGDWDTLADLIEGSGNIFTIIQQSDAQIAATKKRMETEYQQQLKDIDNNDSLDAETKEERKKELTKIYNSNMTAIDMMDKANSILTANQAALKANTHALERAEEAIKKGDLSGYKTKIKALTKNSEASTKAYNDYTSRQIAAAKEWKNEDGTAFFKDDASTQATFAKWEKQADKIISGNVDGYDELLDSMSETEQKYFNKYLEQREKYYDKMKEDEEALQEVKEAELAAIVEMQESAVELYKSQLEDEYDALKESLDKRKELYQDYFDAINDEDDAEDYESDYERLQSAIASLSGATDAASLNKLKEYQKQLDDLEEERRDTERQNRQDATISALDDESEFIEEMYNKAIENNQAIWQSFQDLGWDAIWEMYKKVNGFDKLTSDDAKQKMFNEFTSTYGLDETTWAQNKKTTTDEKTFNKNASDDTVDSTGSAGVDGTKSKPKILRSSEGTSSIGNLESNLTTIRASRTEATGSTETTTNTIGAININVTGVEGDGKKIGNSIFQVFSEEATKRGISFNRKK